ncbi:MAG: O-antigen ligase family protein, partial [Candidatus Paceibacterales bacterium]
FQNKLHYMDYDLFEYRHGTINDHSDAMRLLSMKIGLEIWKSNPILGVGSGDLENATNALYETKYTDISVANRRTPHNQFIWVLASTGIVGLVFFLLAFFYPFIVMRHYKYLPLVILYIIIFSSFFSEVTLEEQMGTAFYLIFLLLFLNHLQQE